MIATHYIHLPCSINWFDSVDDFGNVVTIAIGQTRAWANAYRFANGQTFEQSGMHSIDCLVEEH